MGGGVRCVWWKSTEERREDRRLAQVEKVRLREERERQNPHLVQLPPPILTADQIARQRLLKKERKEAARAYKRGLQDEMPKMLPLSSKKSRKLIRRFLPSQFWSETHRIKSRKSTTY